MYPVKWLFIMMMVCPIMFATSAYAIGSADNLIELEDESQRDEEEHVEYFREKIEEGWVTQKKRKLAEIKSQKEEDLLNAKIKKEEKLSKIRKNLEEKIKKNLFNQEKEKYNKILKVAMKMLKPYWDKEESSGGQVRIIFAKKIFDELWQIHKKIDYGTDQKKSELNNLFIKANEQLIELDGMNKYHYSVEVTSKQANSNLIEYLKHPGKQAWLFGPSGRVGPMCQLGGQVAMGCYENEFGRRKLLGLFGGNAYADLLGVGSVMFNAYDLGQVVKDHRRFDLYRGSNGGLGAIAGAEIGFLSNNPHHPANFEGFIEAASIVGIGLEVGLGVQAGIHSNVIAKLASLPTDYKKLRKNLGLEYKQGSLNDEVLKKLRQATEEKELYFIYQNAKGRC